MRTNLTTQIMRLRKRRAQLREILALESEIDGMELRLIGTKAEAVRDITNLVCASYGVCRSAVMSTLRSIHVVTPRHMIWYLARNLVHPRPTYTDLGRLFDRDHGSIMHGIRNTEKMRDTNPKFRVMLEQIEAKCKQNEN